MKYVKLKGVGAGCVRLVVTGLKGHTKTACVVVKVGVYLFLTSTLHGSGRSVRLHASAV
jgi:hypothetical protein